MERRGWGRSRRGRTLRIGDGDDDRWRGVSGGRGSRLSARRCPQRSAQATAIPTSTRPPIPAPPFPSRIRTTDTHSDGPKSAIPRGPAPSPSDWCTRGCATSVGHQPRRIMSPSPHAHAMGTNGTQSSQQLRFRCPKLHTTPTGAPHHRDAVPSTEH